jgi:hypothetical protein
MSRARLEARTGTVIHHGRALLGGYLHCFDHKGKDGTAKGNIRIVRDTPGQFVQGVLYELSSEQVEILRPYEGGYEVIEVELQLPSSPQQSQARARTAFTYISVLSTRGLQPLESYVEHYLCGMLENDFPQAYVESIRRQAK